MGSILFTILIQSCQYDDDNIQTTEEQQLQEIYKSKILVYTNSLKELVSKGERKSVDSFESEIDFNSLSLYDLQTTEKLIIADKLNSESYKTDQIEKYIFYLNKGKVVRGNKVVFEDKSHFDKHEILLTNILNREKDKLNYSGSIIIYSPSNNKYLENTFENGILVKNSVLTIKKKANARGVTSCTDWYWVTTYASGAQTWDYMYTTCIEDCTMSRNGYLRCGGGDGGSGGSSGGEISTPSLINFPPNPVDDEIYEVITPEGYFTRYQYNALTGNWNIILKSIPDILVSSAPQTYYFLPFLIPGSTTPLPVLGPDNFEYIYDAGSATWVGTPIEPEVANPCEEIKKLLERNAFKSRLAIINQHYENVEHIEHGYMENVDGTFTKLTSDRGHELDINITPQSKGFMHIHLNPYTDDTGDEQKPIHMFSPKDIGKFIRLIQNSYANRIPQDQIYGVMSSSSGIYMLKFSGELSDLVGVNFNYNSREVNNEYKNYIEDLDIELGFLKFLNNYGIKGVDLMKIDPINNSSKKIEYNTTDLKIEYKNCN